MGSLASRHAEPERVAVTVLSDPTTLASIVYGGRPIADTVARQTLRIKGDPAVLERFTTLSPLAPKATAARDRNDPSRPSTSPSPPSLSARRRRERRPAMR